MEKARLRYKNRPEAVIAEIVATPGPWSRIQFFRSKVPIEAMLHLVNLLREGAEGVERAAVRAKELCESAIEKGDNVSAMKNLGNLLREGVEGVDRDAVQFVELYERAIEKGDIDAMNNMGTLLERSASAVRVVRFDERAIEGDIEKSGMEDREGVGRDAARAKAPSETAIENVRVETGYPVPCLAGVSRVCFPPSPGERTTTAFILFLLVSTITKLKSQLLTLDLDMCHTPLRLGHGPRPLKF